MHIVRMQSASAPCNSLASWPQAPAPARLETLVQRVKEKMDGLSRDDWTFANTSEFDFNPFYDWFRAIHASDLDALSSSFGKVADNLSVHESGEQRAEMA